MTPNAATHLRLARPSHDLSQAEKFWVGGLDLEVLYRAGPEAEGGHSLLMVGWPDAAWHLELVGDPEGETPPAPSEEDLLVLYLGQPVAQELIDSLTINGGLVVQARNPYWDRYGVTIVDPDGYRLVLCHRSWG